MIEHYVAVCKENGFEYTGEIDTDTKWLGHAKQRIRDECVRKSGLKNTRKNPNRIVKVELFKLVIEQGKLVRQFAGRFVATPPLERMTEQEYNEEWNELLKDIPKEFHSFIMSDCYERGHSAGYEEVINYAHEMCHNIKEPIKKFKESLL